jgi:predicted GNAT family N-acyltransferase
VTPHPSSEWGRRHLRAAPESAGLGILVIKLDGAVVATTYLNVIPNLTRSASPYALTEKVVVAESLRSMGIDKQIMEHTLQAAWDAG